MFSKTSETLGHALFDKNWLTVHIKHHVDIDSTEPGILRVQVFEQ